MDREREKKRVAKAIKESHLVINSPKNSPEINLDAGGSNIGIAYKMAFILTELVDMDMLDYEDLDHIVELTKLNLEPEESDQELFKNLIPVDPEELSPHDQKLQKAIEDALRANGIGPNARIVPMIDKRENRNKRRRRW